MVHRTVVFLNTLVLYQFRLWLLAACLPSTALLFFRAEEQQKRNVSQNHIFYKHGLHRMNIRLPDSWVTKLDARTSFGPAVL